MGAHRMHSRTCTLLCTGEIPEIHLWFIRDRAGTADHQWSPDLYWVIAGFTKEPTQSCYYSIIAPAMDIIDPNIQSYAENFSSPEDPLLMKIAAWTQQHHSEH